MASGIYIITNTKSGKFYIGQAGNIEYRFSQHITALRKGKHHNAHLQNAYSKDGEAVFQFDVLEHCEIDELDQREQYYLDLHMPTGKCYNIAPFAGINARGQERPDLWNTYIVTVPIEIKYESEWKRRKREAASRMKQRAHDIAIAAGIPVDDQFIFHDKQCNNTQHASHKLHIDYEYAALISVRVRTGDLQDAEGLFNIASKKRQSRNEARRRRKTRKREKEQSS